MADDIARRIALWRYQILAALLFLEPRRGAFKAAIEHIASLWHEHPVKGLIKVARSTIEHWLCAYRRDGLDGLTPAPRKDCGSSRRIDDVLAEAIETLAQDRPDLDGPTLLAELTTQHPDRQMPSLPTLYRFLRKRGLDQRRAPARRDHRAFVFDLAGDCWHGDVMFGPHLNDRDGRPVRTFLIAILDDASRLVVHAQFYLEQNLAAIKDCLKQALLKRGRPRRLYFDNGKIFRSRLLLLLAARLGIQLLHTRPYQPQGRAKLERWFGTIRRSFLPRVDLERVGDVEALNRLLWAWVEGSYHREPHRSLEGETPLDRWLRLSEGLRPLPNDVDLDELFLDETTRRVKKDGTFTIDGKTFEAGPHYIGQRITVRFDASDLRRVFLLEPTGERITVEPVDLAGNRRVRRLPAAPAVNAATTRLRSLEDLARQVDQDREPNPNHEHREDNNTNRSDDHEDK
jgi:transposase InsO family protein